MDGSGDEVNRENPGSAGECLKIGVEKALGDIRGRGMGGFFSFDHMYFPRIATCLFIAMVLLSLAGIAVGVISGLAAVFTSGAWIGLTAIVFVVVGGVIGIFFIRIFFEMLLLAFKINEGIQEMRDRVGK